jgi:hypothetical protein
MSEWANVRKTHSDIADFEHEESNHKPKKLVASKIREATNEMNY